MEQINTRNNEVNFKQVLDGRYYDTSGAWLDMDDVTRNDLAIKFKEFLLSKCRKGSQPYNNIRNTTLLECENFGVYERLVYNFNTDSVHYVAGQDYPAEIAYLKKLVLKTA